MNRKLVMNEVVLVNSKDEELGTMEKLAAHKSGHLHRAFSIFIFNDAGEMLIQKRASSKYHSANLWTNACCSHPAPNEKIEDAAKRRLKEELYLETPVDWVFSFEYKTEFENGLIENELDHVLVGHSNDKGIINPDEISALKFISIKELFKDLDSHPENYSIWFKIIVSKYWTRISTNLEKRKLYRA
jgi:isopentenyl-diphosphate delta-isomerase